MHYTFHHIPKTGGSSLRIRLEDRADKKQISKLDYAVGHNTTHRSPGTHFVWLRHPLDRDISQYNYDMGKGDIEDATFQQHCRNLLGNFTVLWLHKNYLCLNTQEPIEIKYKMVRDSLKNKFENKSYDHAILSSKKNKLILFYSEESSRDLISVLINNTYCMITRTGCNTHLMHLLRRS